MRTKHSHFTSFYGQQLSYCLDTIKLKRAAYMLQVITTSRVKFGKLTKFFERN